jgi:hypothetical protein
MRNLFPMVIGTALLVTTAQSAPVSAQDNKPSNSPNATQNSSPNSNQNSNQDNSRYSRPDLPPGGQAQRNDQNRDQMTANQISAEMEARIARMKADLRLTPDQAKTWPDVEKVLMDQSKGRAERYIAARSERGKQTGPDNFLTAMKREADTLGARSADLKKLADAAGPLFNGLDDQQRRIFARDLMRLDMGLR